MSQSLVTMGTMSVQKSLHLAVGASLSSSINEGSAVGGIVTSSVDPNVGDKMSDQWRGLI